jgi:hypothetical protein
MMERRLSEGEVIAALVREFGAVEVDRHPRVHVLSRAADCPYRAHAGREWRLAGSNHWVCGACHEPVVGLQIERGGVTR